MVWEDGPADPTERFVLLAMADTADDGGFCWPSVGRIATRCCMSERNARRVIRKLELSGWVTTEVQPGRNKSNRYMITKPDTAMSARTICPPGQTEHENRTNETLKPDTAMSAEQSITIIEPSSNKISDVSEVLGRWASEPAVKSFIAYRKGHKAKALTKTAATRLAANLQKIFNEGGDADDALGLAEERGWASVEPDWYFKAKGNGNGTGNSNINGAYQRRPGGPNDSMVAAFAFVADRHSHRS